MHLHNDYANFMQSDYAKFRQTVVPLPFDLRRIYAWHSWFTRDLRMIPGAASNTHDTRDLRMIPLIYAGRTHDTLGLGVIYAWYRE